MELFSFRIIHMSEIKYNQRKNVCKCRTRNCSRVIVFSYEGKELPVCLKGARKWAAPIFTKEATASNDSGVMSANERVLYEANVKLLREVEDLEAKLMKYETPVKGIPINQN